MTDLVKIFFHLQQDEDGYPEVSAESVWAKPTGAADEYIVDNIPFFTRDATIGDTLKALKKEGALWFDSLRQRSGGLVDDQLVVVRPERAVVAVAVERDPRDATHRRDVQRAEPQALQPVPQGEHLVCDIVA